MGVATAAKVEVKTEAPRECHQLSFLINREEMFIVKFVTIPFFITPLLFDARNCRSPMFSYGNPSGRVESLYHSENG